MGTTALSDVIVPELFDKYTSEKVAELADIFTSGLVARNGKLAELAKSEGLIHHMPFFDALTADEPNLSSDAVATLATPAAVTADQILARKQFNNKGWSAADLVTPVIGSDPMGHASMTAAQYWARVLQKNMVNSMKGVLADNVANDSADMRYNVANDLASAITAAELISGDAIVEAMQTAGDAAEMLTTVVMHSRVAATARKLGLATTVQLANNLTVEVILGNKRLIIDDGMPAVAGSNRITYTTAIMGPGAFQYGEGAPKVPVELQRIENAGNGEGAETLWQRRHFILHPLGFSFTSASVSGKSPSWAELATAGNWNRVWERKNIPMAFLTTNG